MKNIIYAKLYNKLSISDKYFTLIGVYHNGKSIFKSFSKNRLIKFVDLLNTNKNTIRKISISDLTI